MRSTLALLSVVSSAAAQAVTSLIVPSSAPPAGCANSRVGEFAISIVNASTPAAPTVSNEQLEVMLDGPSAALVSRQSSGTLTMSLSGGILTDQDGRTGYIASNYQFQFDKPPQAGAIYTGGFSICSNGSLALGGNAIFWSCLSGTFYNLYDRDWAPHCEPVYFQSQSVGTVFTTSPPVPASTGPSQNTIANGGGTQSQRSNATASGIVAGGSSTAALTTGASGTGAGSSGAQSTGASASGSASGSSGASGASGSAGSPSSSSSAAGAAGAFATDAPQALFAWAAAGLMGAIALV